MINRSHIRFEGMFVNIYPKGVKNGSMTGFMSNLTLLYLLWNCIWLGCVVDNILCGEDEGPYFVAKKW
jgi:hypothetical protein